MSRAAKPLTPEQIEAYGALAQAQRERQEREHMAPIARAFLPVVHRVVSERYLAGLEDDGYFDSWVALFMKNYPQREVAPTRSGPEFLQHVADCACADVLPLIAAMHARGWA